ncbi:MAG: tRNA (adenosine(37)-N6)-threonylcarbamoyltransferase complex dimerization subunit type 1 TsaB [Clostridia bacterium]
MNILCLDTSTEKIVFALLKDNKIIEFIGEAGSKKHNSTLLPLLDKFLKENEITIKNIDIYAVVVGPGSFTGIRIGVATVNAFALTNQKQIVEITSLEQVFEGDKDMLVGLSCKHDNYYCANKIDKKIEYLPLNIDEIKNLGKEMTLFENSNPSKMMNVAIKKIANKEFVNQAKPFYMKRSSAERETGIKC